MTQYRDAAQAIRAYFESYGRLASAKGLQFTGMPLGGDSQAQEHMQAKHGDHVLRMKDLTRQEMDAAYLYYGAAAGTRQYVRYVRTANEAREDELITKRSHPDDPTLIEVTGTMTRGCDLKEVARIMEISQNRATQLLSWARTKVAKRMKEQETEE
mgnify:FL=1